MNEMSDITAPSRPGLDTVLIHGGDPRPRLHGAVVHPIFQSATYEIGRDGAVRYARSSNTPNHDALARKLAALENGETALVTASGMAAIATTLLTVLSSGNHLLAQDCLYGGTYGFLRILRESFAIESDSIDADVPSSWRAKLRPTTRAIYVEAMTNPLLGVGDLSAVAAFARAHGLISIIDNTFATPVNFRPLEHGFDLSIHSCTKYMNGHDDIAAGAIVGRADLVGQIAQCLNRLGGALDPHAAFLLQRGMKTLGVRVRHQNASALKVAAFLEAHPAVAQVNYPGLTSHPQHRRARELFEGFGGVMSFELRGGAAAAARFMEAIELAVAAPSLGGVETLVMRPAAVSHVNLSPQERAALGISDGLVRLSVGLEAVEDLIADLDRALGQIDRRAAAVA
jgi:cystathionine beta-lyase/cystathionine gamma-synthase